MKLKTAYFLFLLLVFFIASNNDLYAFYAKGDTLYVLAHKGLNMRAMPNPNATLLQELAYGTKVIISSDSVFDAYQVEDIKDFFITGNWRKVCTHDACGYVFDGYLSTFVAPPIKYEVPEIKYYEKERYESVIGDYFRRFLKLKSKKTILAKQKHCSENRNWIDCIYKWEETFGESIYYSVKIDEYNSSELLQFTNASFTDISLLSKIWLLMGNSDNDPINTCMRYDKTKNEIYFFACERGGGCYYTLKQESGKIILEGGCGC